MREMTHTAVWKQGMNNPDGSMDNLPRTQRKMAAILGKRKLKMDAIDAFFERDSGPGKSKAMQARLADESENQLHGHQNAFDVLAGRLDLKAMVPAPFRLPDAVAAQDFKPATSRSLVPKGPQTARQQNSAGRKVRLRKAPATARGAASKTDLAAAEPPPSADLAIGATSALPPIQGNNAHVVHSQATAAVQSRGFQGGGLKAVAGSAQVSSVKDFRKSPELIRLPADGYIEMNARRDFSSDSEWSAGADGDNADRDLHQPRSRQQARDAIIRFHSIK